MSDAGYTLVETLAALLVLTLAMSGLAGSMKVLSDQQARVTSVIAQNEARQRAQAALDALFAGQGPFGSHQPQRFDGNASALTFDCQAAAPCGAQLDVRPQGLALILRAESGEVTYPLPGAGGRFVYEGRRGVSATWPPQSSERQALRAVSLETTDAGRTLLRSPVWLEQPVNCAFDPVLEDCR